MYLSPVPLSILYGKKVKYSSTNKLWGVALPTSAIGVAQWAVM